MRERILQRSIQRRTEKIKEIISTIFFFSCSIRLPRVFRDLNLMIPYNIFALNSYINQFHLRDVTYKHRVLSSKLRDFSIRRRSDRIVPRHCADIRRWKAVFPLVGFLFFFVFQLTIFLNDSLLKWLLSFN